MDFSQTDWWGSINTMEERKSPETNNKRNTKRETKTNETNRETTRETNRDVDNSVCSFDLSVSQNVLCTYNSINTEEEIFTIEESINYDNINTIEEKCTETIEKEGSVENGTLENIRDNVVEGITMHKNTQDLFLSFISDHDKEENKLPSEENEMFSSEENNTSLSEENILSPNNIQSNMDINNIPCGFVTGNNKEIKIKEDLNKHRTLLEIGNTPIDSVITKENNTKENINIRENITKENINNVPADFTCAFTTGNNKPITIPREHIEKAHQRENITSNITGNIMNRVYGEPTTYTSQNKDPSSLEVENIVENDINIIVEPDRINTNTSINNTSDAPKRVKLVKNNSAYKIHISQNQQSHIPIRKYNCPQSGHITQKLRDDVRLIELYEKCLVRYMHKSTAWIEEQFKWSWMGLAVSEYTRGINSSSSIISVYTDDVLVERVFSLMDLRLKNEYSLFSAILSNSIPVHKYMILGIISVGETWVELYDGYYSIKVGISRKVHEMIKRCEMGSKIHVFGMEKRMKEEISVQEYKNRGISSNNNTSSNINNILYLNVNGVRLCFRNIPIGPRRMISYYTCIKSIHIDGGVVPGIKIEITKIVEEKYLLICGNYRKKIETEEEIGEEIEKMSKIAEKAGKEIKREEINIKRYIKRYIKMIIKDESEECLLTWWNGPEVKKGEKYDMVYLIPRKGSIGIHLNTHRMTYYQRRN